MPNPTLRDAYCRWCERTYQIGIDDTLDQHRAQCEEFQSVEYDRAREEEMMQPHFGIERGARRSPA